MLINKLLKRGKKESEGEGERDEEGESGDEENSLEGDEEDSLEEDSFEKESGERDTKKASNTLKKPIEATQFKYDHKGISLRMNFFDACWKEEFIRFRTLTLPNSNVVIVCYDVNDLESFNEIETTIVFMISQRAPKDVRIVLCGMKVDLRVNCEESKEERESVNCEEREKERRDCDGMERRDCDRESKEDCDRESKEDCDRESKEDCDRESKEDCDKNRNCNCKNCNKNNPRRIIHPWEGERLAMKIKAEKFFECSGRTGEGIEKLFVYLRGLQVVDCDCEIAREGETARNEREGERNGCEREDERNGCEGETARNEKLVEKDEGNGKGSEPARNDERKGNKTANGKVTPKTTNVASPKTTNVASPKTTNEEREQVTAKAEKEKETARGMCKQKESESEEKEKEKREEEEKPRGSFFFCCA